MSPLTQNILLGISLAAPIGPVSIEIIRRGLAQGFWAALPVCLGAAFGDLVYLLMAFFGLAPFMSGVMLRLSIMSMGSLILIFMGISSLKSVFKDKNLFQTKTQSSQKNGFILGALLAMVNPMTVVWWVGIFGSVMGSNPSESTGLASIAEYSLIIVGILSWTLSISVVLHFSKKLITPVHLKWITGLAGIFLIFFGFEFGQKVVKEALDIQNSIPLVESHSPKKKLG